MRTKTTAEFWTAALFLARCGDQTQAGRPTMPPVALKVGTWKQAFALFYPSLGAGRSAEAFRNSLNNARDALGSHVDTGRAGWRSPADNRTPRTLPRLASTIMEHWAAKPNDDLTFAALAIIDGDNPKPKACDLEASERHEISIYRVLRDTQLARKIKAQHSNSCQPCNHSILLPNGSRYAEAHHIMPLGIPHNGPDISQNIVCVCPNHYVELDLGAIEISVAAIATAEGHSVSEEFIRSHNQVIFKGRDRN